VRPVRPAVWALFALAAAFALFYFGTVPGEVLLGLLIVAGLVSGVILVLGRRGWRRSE